MEGALLPTDAEGLVPIPARQNGVALSVQIGWSFSRRFALLAEFVLVAGGVVLLRKPKLLLDIQVRSGTLWYDQFRATNLSVQLGVMRRRS